MILRDDRSTGVPHGALITSNLIELTDSKLVSSKAITGPLTAIELKVW